MANLHPVFLLHPSFNFIIIKIGFLPLIVFLTVITGVYDDIYRKRFIYVRVYEKTLLAC